MISHAHTRLHQDTEVWRGRGVGVLPTIHQELLQQVHSQERAHHGCSQGSTTEVVPPRPPPAPQKIHTQMVLDYGVRDVRERNRDARGYMGDTC